MSIKHRLVQRKSVWYYRRRVPPHLIPVIGKKFIQHSLKTKDLNEAAKRRTLADVEWDARFQEAEEAKENGTTVKTILPRSEALRIVREYLEAADKKFQIIEAKRDCLTEEQIRDIQIEDETYVQMFEDLSNPEAELQVGTEGYDLLQKHGIDPNLPTDEYAQFFEFVRRALLELHRRSAARHRQEFDKPFFDHLFGPEGHPAKSAKDMTFGKLCDQYFESFVTDAPNKKVSQQRIDQVDARLKLIREIISKDTMVGTIDYDQCLAFRSTLAQVPTNRMKIYPGVPLQEVIKRADKKGRPRLT